MVCDRCKSTVLHEMNEAGFHVDSIELGQVSISDSASGDLSKVEIALKQHGFEIIKDETLMLVENIKIALINKIEQNMDDSLSAFLTKAFNKSYSALSKLFSKTEGLTIEKYEINLKIEKVKELIQLRQLNFSEIAYSLSYKNSSHLARQFKSVTGMSMSDYKNLQQWNRKTLDQIV